VLARHRCDKGIASAGIVDDVALALAAIAERPAQRRDVDPQGALVDNRIGPGASDEMLPRERLAGMFDKRDQDVERAAAQAQRLSVVEHRPLCGDQPKRSEDEGFVTHSGAVLPAHGFI
jgi:hypothetical protein